MTGDKLEKIRRGAALALQSPRRDMVEMNGVSDWDGRPRVNADGDLEVMTQDEFGNRYSTVIFKGGVHGFRCGPKASPDEPPKTISLFAGAEVYVEVKNYVEDRKVIIDWVKEAK